MLIAINDARLELLASGLELLAVLLLAVGVFALVGLLARVFEQLPIGRRGWTRLRRARPVVEISLALACLIVGVPVVFAGHDTVTQLVLAALLLAALAASWSALRDLMQGILIRSGELCRPGDRVAVGPAHAGPPREGRQEGSAREGAMLGVVARLGYRTLTLTTDDGAELFIPYTELSRHAILRVPRTRGVHRHSFELELGEAVDPLRAIDRIKRLALSCHWSSVVREPEIDAVGGRTLRVQVFALGHEHGPAIEASIRRGLAD